MSKILVTDGQEWSFDMIDDVYNEINRIWTTKYKRPIYPNQLEVISSEQMLDAYSAVGMPIMYNHWSFGEQLIRETEAYRRGYMGLAYEIVINSDPCIAYLMEENTMLMQTLVIAHASFGHNTFFKNNYLFRQWTDAGSIIDYLAFAKKYIADCEERYGVDEVEAVLDAAHSLQHYGVDKYKRPPRLSPAEEKELQRERERYNQSQINLLWRTIPKSDVRKDSNTDETEQFPKEPQENILYFIEKNAPRLEDWKREVIRIVRKISQYFYPQSQTKMMNEGCATYFHYKLIHDLYDEGIVDDGALLEFYDSHTGVVRQLGFDHKFYSGINPYALGFAMYRDIERVAMEPTEEDREWFGNQEWVGCGDYLRAIDFAISSFKDESFIQQFLTPKVIRDFKMFALHDDERDPKYLVTGIHNKQGYKTIREALAKQYNIGYIIPDIQVYNVDRWGDRSMTLRHYMVNRRPLEADQTTETLKKIAFLWGYDVKLESVDENQEVRANFEVQGDKTLLDLFLDDGNRN
jgi:stage V sporulation protein R